MHRIAVPREHPAFDGHFPGRPLFPGAALLDEMLHLCERELDLDPTRWRLESAKFLAAVGPDTELAVEIEATAQRLQLTARAGGQIAVRAMLSRIGS